MKIIFTVYKLLFLQTTDLYALDIKIWKNIFSSYASKKNFLNSQTTRHVSIFTHASPIKTSPLVHYHPLPRPLPRWRNYSFSQHLFENLFSPTSRKREGGLWFALLKFNQKTWRWLGTTSYLYFLWFVIFFKCEYFIVLSIKYLPYSMEVILLSFTCSNHDNLILKLHQKK